MTVKVGVIGVGGVATRYHFPVWDEIPELEVVGVCDLVREKAEAAVARFGGQVYPNHEALIEESDVDALFIFLPPFAHEDQEVLAARRGIPFFVEKPICLTIEKAREIERVVAETGVMTSVGYNWRYQDSTQRAKSILEGVPIAMAMGYWLGTPPRINEWKGKMALSGGQIVKQTTHIVDTLRYLVGEVESVYFRQALRTLEIDGFDEPDVGTMTLQFENGVIGTLTNACMLPNARRTRIGVEILAKDLDVTLRMDGLTVAREDRITEYLDRPFSRGPVDENPYWREVMAFIEAVKTGDASPIRSTYSDAVKTLEISTAANRSAETGQVVSLRH
jgi:predicted dehydrogenase